MMSCRVAAFALWLVLAFVSYGGGARAENVAGSREAQARWLRAKALYDANDCDGAVAAFSEALEKDAATVEAGLAIVLIIDCLAAQKRHDAIMPLGPKYCSDPRLLRDAAFVRICQDIYTPPVSKAHQLRDL